MQNTAQKQPKGELIPIAAQIAQLAHDRKKPKKADCFAIMRDFIDDLPIEIAEQKRQELAAIYAFFVPSVAKPKTTEQWISTAMADKRDPRYYLQYIHSDGTRLVATDGHRIHCWSTDKYPAGYYDKTMQPLPQVDARYPDIDQVIPSLDDSQHAIPLADLQENLIAARDANREAYKLPTGQSLNAKYVKQAAHGLPDPIVHIFGKGQPVVIVSMTDLDKFAVVMPILR